MKHYRTLKVATNATPEEIKQAYRKAAAIHHPDKGGSAAMFQEIQTAWEVLKDPDKRKAYDEAESKKPVEEIAGSVEIILDEIISAYRKPTGTHAKP